jgi:hypothetical protein
MRKVFLLIGFLCASINIFAERIILSDGTVLVGTIIEQNENEITITTNIGEVIVQKENVERIEYSTNYENDKIIKNSCLVVRPLATIIAGIIGATDVVFEGQTAITKNFTLTSIGEIGMVRDVLVTGLNIGIQYNFNGKYLDGFYAGIYPGYIYATDFYSQYSSFSGMIDFGYQGVLVNDFIWGAYCGYYIAEASAFKFGLKIGWAFPDPLFRKSE